MGCNRGFHQPVNAARVILSQGSHFTSSDYLNLLEKNQISISMDGKGRATDNAITERFFLNLKWEKLYYHAYDSPKEVYRDVRAYIDEYNCIRPHQSLQYAKPVEFLRPGRMIWLGYFFHSSSPSFVV